MLWLLPMVAFAAAVTLIAGERDAPAPAAEETRPELLLMTALPIVWGEGGVEDVLAGRGGPSAAYRALEKRFTVTPVDAIDAPTLAGKRLMLLAQPRALAPGEFFDLDEWVRGGGRALILTDPALAWPSGFGLGHPRRPPVIGHLGPLLSHWGLALEPPAEDAPVLVVRDLGGVRVRLAAPGHFVRQKGDCRLAAEGLVARCRIGAGQALLVADADLLDDRLWSDGAANLAAVVAWLDELSD